MDHLTDDVTFTCQSMAGPNLNYTWLINGSTASGNGDVVINNTELIVNNVTYLLGGRYTCVVTNMAGEGRDSSYLFGELLTVELCIVSCTVVADDTNRPHTCHL